MQSKHREFFIADFTPPQQHSGNNNAADQNPSLPLKNLGGKKAENEKWLFSGPEEIICANEYNEIDEAMQKINACSRQKKYLAGYISFEAGCYLNHYPIKSAAKSTQDLPLIWFGVFSKPEPVAQPVETEYHYISKPEAALESSDYLKRFEQIKALIKEGYIYQMNFTFPLEFTFYGNPVDFFLN